LSRIVGAFSLSKLIEFAVETLGAALSAQGIRENLYSGISWFTFFAR